MDIWEAFCEDIRPPQLRKRLRSQRARLFHIDGGRTTGCARHGLGLAESALTPDGCIFLDDFMNESWPGITEGAFEYLRGESRLIPFALIKNKLGLCYEQLHEAFFKASVHAAEEMELEQRKEIVLFGHSVYMGR